jgi:hypothetical protein
MATQYAFSQVVTNGLVLSMNFADPNSYVSGSTTSTDLSGLGNTGTIENTPGYSSLNGGSLVLNGTTNRVLVTCAANTIRSYDSTCHFAVKLPLYSGAQRCILSYRGGGGGNLYIGKQSGGIFTFYDSLNVAPYTVGSITNDTVAIVAVIANATGGSMSVYINGVLAGTATGRTGFSTAYNNTMYLGYDAGGTNEYMVGNFYNFMHYNRVLSADEILQNYNAQKSRFGLA